MTNLGVAAEAANKQASPEGTAKTQNPVCFEIPSNYEITVSGKKLKQKNLTQAGFSAGKVTFKDVRLKGLEEDITYLGCISGAGKTELMPSNETIMYKDFRLVSIE